jgi:hypothetical protein
MCLSKMAVFSSSSSQSMSIEPVDALPDVMGTVGVSPNDGLAAGFTDGIGKPGIGGAGGTGNEPVCDKLPAEGGGTGSGATDVTGGGGAGSPLNDEVLDCGGAE